MQTDVRYMDFDQLDHIILLNKLTYYGFSRNLASFFQSYLTNRLQYVAYGDFAYKAYYATSEVPQGSIV